MMIGIWIYWFFLLYKYFFQMPDFDGKELSLELRGNGWLGSFEDSSGIYKEQN